MQSELKQIFLRWISILFDSESEYLNLNKQSDFLSSQQHSIWLSEKLFGLVYLLPAPLRGLTYSTRFGA